MRRTWIPVTLLVVAGGLVLIMLNAREQDATSGAGNAVPTAPAVPDPTLRGRDTPAGEKPDDHPAGATHWEPGRPPSQGRLFNGSVIVMGAEDEAVRVDVYDETGDLHGSATGRANTEIPIPSLPWSVLRVEAEGAGARSGWAWIRPSLPCHVTLADAMTIRGTVRASDDQVVSDAVVLAYYVTDDGVFTSRRDLGRTDDLGAFEVPHPGPGAHLFVLHAVWGGAWLEIPPDLRTSLSVVLGAGETRQRTFVVRDEGNRPVPAVLEWVVAGVVLWEGLEVSGPFSLQWPPHEALRVRVSAPGFVPRGLETVEPGTTEPEVVTLARGTDHLVRVLDDRGLPVLGAALNVLGPLPGTPNRLHRVRALHTDESGTAHVSVPTGAEYVFTVISPGSRVQLATLDRPEVTVTLDSGLGLTVRLPAPAERDWELSLLAFDGQGRMYWGCLETVDTGISEVLIRDAPAGRKVLEANIPGQRAQEREIYDESLVELSGEAEPSSVHVALKGELADDALPYRLIHVDTETEVAAGRSRAQAIRLQVARPGRYRLDLAPPLSCEGPAFEATPGENVKLTWNTDECGTVVRWTPTVTDSKSGALVAEGVIRYGSGDWSGQTGLSGGTVSLLLPADDDVRVRLSAPGHFEWVHGPTPGWELKGIDQIVLERSRRLTLTWDASRADRLDVYCLLSMAGGGISHARAQPGDTIEIPLHHGLLWAVSPTVVAAPRWIHHEENEVELALVMGPDLVVRTDERIKGIVVEYPSLGIGVSPPGDWTQRPVREVQDLERVPGRLSRTADGGWLVPPLLEGAAEVHIYRPGGEGPEIRRVELVAGKRTILTDDPGEE